MTEQKVDTTFRDNLLDALDRAYPAFNGHWRIDIDVFGGVIYVTNRLLSGKWGFVMHINKVDAEGKKVVRNAGELLERFRVSRNPNADIFSILGMQRDQRGELLVDKS
jgi:hypothetical protein